MRESRTITPHALELARKFGSRWWETRLLLAELYELICVGRWDEAVARGEALLAGEGDASLTRGSMLEVLALSIVYVHRGELGEARRILATMPEAESSSDLQERTTYLCFLAGVLRAEGRFREALEAAEGAFAAREELGMRSATAKDGAVETLEAAFALGDAAKIEETLGMLESLRPGEPMPFIQAHGARVSARFAASRSDADGADAAFASATQTFRELANPFWLAVTVVEHAEWLLSRRCDADAAPLHAEAREIFEQLKAKPWLERLAGSVPLEAGSKA